MPMIPFVKNGYYGNRNWIPLVNGNGLTAGGGEPDPEYETVTGNPVTFNALTPFPLKQLSVAFSPVQDLNGYDSPWPAGGGANKWDEEWEVGTISTTTGETVNDPDRIRSKNLIPCVPQTSYYVVDPTSGANVRLFYYDASQNFIRASAWTGNTAFTTPEDAHYLKFIMASTYGATYNHDIAINYPSSVTTYSPYSNICPILGWDSLNVEQGGKNLWNGKFVSAGFTESDTYSSTYKYVGNAYMPIKAGASYVASVDGTRASIRYCFLTAAKTRIGDYTNADATTVAPANAVYLQWRLQSDYGANTKGQIELGSTASPYQPYNPSSRSISINLGQTVYSGYVDVVTGVLTVDSVEKMASSLSWYNNASYANTFNGEGFTTRKRYIHGSNANGCYCDSYKWYTSSDVGSSDSGIALANATSGTVAAQTRIYIKDTRFATAGEFAASLNTNDVKIVCPLATPLAISLTPQEIQSLAGDNTMWSDAQNLEVTYRSN